MEPPSIISPEVASEQPILPSSGNSPEKKDNHAITIASMAIFVILSLLAVGFLYNQNQKLKKMLSESAPKATPSAIPTTTPDPTSDWLVYENKTVGFGFKYPKKLTMGEAGVSGPFGGNATLIESFSDPQTVREGTDAPFDGFSVWKVTLTGNTNFENYIDNELIRIKSSEFATDSPTKTPIEINGVKGYSINFSSTIKYHYLPSPDGKTVIEISRIFTNQDFLGIFDQILYSFEFTKMTTPMPTQKPVMPNEP